MKKKSLKAKILGMGKNDLQKIKGGNLANLKSTTVVGKKKSSLQ